MKVENIQHSTSNAEHPMTWRTARPLHWKLNVECWALNVRLVICLLGALWFGVSAPAESLLLKNAVVHTVSGETQSPGDVLVRDGKIAAVGKSLTARDAGVVGAFLS